MSRDIEAKVVSSMVRDRFILTRVLGDGFSPEVIRDPNLQSICRILYDMSQLPDQVIDWVTLEENLKAQDRFTPEINKTLKEIRNETDGLEADQVMAYAEILKDQHLRDGMLKLSNMMEDYSARKGPHKDLDIVDFSTRMIQSLIEMQKRKAQKRVYPLRVTIDEIKEIADQRRGDEKSILGYKISPHDRLQEILSGIRRGFYYGLAGPPRRGKTTLALDIASRLAEANNIPVLFYTWEQTRRTLASRLLGRECYLNPVKLLTEVSPDQPKRHALVNKVIERSRSYSNKLYVIEAGRRDTLDRIKAQAYNIMHEMRTDECAVFLDYLQKIPLQRQYEDIRGQVNEASAQLADLSLELHCPVIAISSMDKEGCKLDEKPPSYDEFSTTYYSRPTMHNCVGGGDLEYDLDVAMVLSKDWVATKNLQERLSLKDEEKQTTDLPQIDIINVHIDKNRDSAGESSPTVQYAFFITINKFVEVGFKHESEYSKEHRGFAKAEDMFASLLDTSVFKL